MMVLGISLAGMLKLDVFFAEAVSFQLMRGLNSLTGQELQKVFNFELQRIGAL